MGYYLKWSEAGQGLPGETLTITGIVGVLTSVEYIVQTSARALNGARYVFDIRKAAVGTISSGGGIGYILQGSTGANNNSGTSNWTKNETPVSSGVLFENFEPNDRFRFEVNSTPSNGTVALGARYNEVESHYGWSLSKVVITDSAGAHEILFSDSGGTGTSVISRDGAITATLDRFPTDDSHWVAFNDAPPENVPKNIQGTFPTTGVSLVWDPVLEAEWYWVEFRRRRT